MNEILHMLWDTGQQHPYLTTLLAAALPITELRGSVPLGLIGFELPLVWVFVLSIIGNILLTIIGYSALYFFVPFLRRHIPLCDTLCTWLFARTQTKHSKNIDRFGHIALIFFVAIPIPGSGGLTGALIAYVFGLSPRHALWFIFLGLVIAATLVCAGSIIMREAILPIFTS